VLAWAGESRNSFTILARSGSRQRASLHAMCVVVDAEKLFVSSANFTEPTQLRNFEVGVLIDNSQSIRILHWQIGQRRTVVADSIRTAVVARILFLATAAFFGSISVASQRRPSPFAAAGIVPPPQNGSTTRSPGRVNLRIRYSASDSACCQS